MDELLEFMSEIFKIIMNLDSLHVPTLLYSKKACLFNKLFRELLTKH